MPYYKRNTYRRFRGPRQRRRYRAARRIQRAFRRRKGKYALRYKFNKVKKIVYQDIEHRWADDIAFSFTLPGAGGAIVNTGLELIHQGDDVGDRTGNKVTLKSFYLKGQIITADTHNFMRILLVNVNSLNQIIIPSDILQPDTTTNDPTIYSPYRKESRIKFKVLFDKMYKTQQQAAGSLYPFLINVDLSYKWKKGKSITYNQAGNSTPIYWYPLLVVISDSQIVTHPTFRGAKRLSWIA